MQHLWIGYLHYVPKPGSISSALAYWGKIGSIGGSQITPSGVLK